KVRTAGMVCIRDIWCQRKDYGRFRQRAVWSLRQIQRRVQLDFVAHRNLDAPAQLIVRRWMRGRWRRSWRLCDDVCCEKCEEHCNRKRSFHVAVLKMNCISETRVLSCRTKRCGDASHSQSASRKMGREHIPLSCGSRTFGVRRVLASLSSFAASPVCETIVK